MSKSYLHYLGVGEHRRPNSFLRHIYLEELIHVPVTEKTTWIDVMDALRVRYADNLEMIEMINEWEADEDPKIMAGKVLNIEPEPGIDFFAIFDIIPSH